MSISRSIAKKVAYNWVVANLPFPLQTQVFVMQFKSQAEGYRVDVRHQQSYCIAKLHVTVDGQVKLLKDRRERVLEIVSNLPPETRVESSPLNCLKQTVQVLTLLGQVKPDYISCVTLAENTNLVNFVIHGKRGKSATVAVWFFNSRHQKARFCSQVSNHELQTSIILIAKNYRDEELKQILVSRLSEIERCQRLV